jgi:hypothetical protein
MPDPALHMPALRVEIVVTMDTSVTGALLALETSSISSVVRAFCKEQADDTVDFKHVMARFASTDISLLERYELFMMICVCGWVYRGIYIEEVAGKQAMEADEQQRVVERAS